MNPGLDFNFYKEKNKQIASLVVIIFSLALFIFFPSSGSIQALTKGLFFLILLPLLFIKFITKEKLTEYGIGLGNKKTGVILSISALILNLIIFLFLFKYSNFSKNYILPEIVVSKFWTFVLYEIVFVNLYLIFNEYFFRGFMLFSLKKSIGSFAILIQFIVFALFLLLTKSFSWQMLPFLILATTGGLTSYLSKSILYSYISGFLSIIILDAYLIANLR